MNEIKKFLIISKYALISSLREKSTLFFAIVFPIILTIILGMSFGKESETELKLGILKKDYSILKELEEMKMLKIEMLKFESENELLKAVRSEDIDLGIKIEKGKLKVFKNRTNEDSELALNIILPKVKAIIMGKSDKERIVLEVERVYMGKKKGSYMDYITTGVIVMSFFNTAVFSTINIIGGQKKEKKYTKILLAPIKAYTLAFGFLFAIILANFISTFIIIFISNVFLKANLNINFLLFIPYFISLNIGSIGFGIFLLLISKERETALSVATFYLNAMLLVSGIFFSKAFLPNYLKFLSYLSPLTYTVDIFRFIIGIEKVSYTYFITIISIFLILGLSLSIFSTEKYFKS